jgi:hypothetical protein
MGENKGKKGEMALVITLATVVSHEEDKGHRCDITRHTNTNTADSGADVVLESPKKVVDNLFAIANGSDSNNNHATHNQLAVQADKIIKTRFDNKNTDSKLGVDTVREFIADVRKNPDCAGHVLTGGSGLTAGANKEMKAAQEAYGDKKLIGHISNEGIKNINANYLSNSPQVPQIQEVSIDPDKKDKE